MAVEKIFITNGWTYQDCKDFNDLMVKANSVNLAQAIGILKAHVNHRYNYALENEMPHLCETCGQVVENGITKENQEKAD